MKILLTATRYHTNQHFWIQTLQNNGHEVFFLVSNKHSDKEYYGVLTPNKVKLLERSLFTCYFYDFLQRLQGKVPKKQFHYRVDKQELEKYFTNFQPDVVIVRDLLFPLSLATFSIAKKKGVPAILYNQYPLEASESIFKRLLRKLLVNTNIRITPTRTSNTEYNRETNTYYVPLVTNFNYDIATKKSSHHETLKLLFVGKYKSERKKHLQLLQVLNEVRQKTSVHLTMVGSDATSSPDYYQSIVDFVQQHKLESVVTLKQNLEYQQMIEEYENHDIFVLPSVNEPFSISPLEAMNHGLPVILTESNGARGVVTPDSGFVIKDNDTKQLSERIFYLACNKDVLQRMSCAAYKRQQEFYGPQNFIQHFNNAVELATKTAQ